MDLIKSFISFDKLMKDRLVIAFFWLGLIVIGLSFFSNALDAIRLGPLAGVAEFFNFFVRLLLAAVTLRLVCELAISVFHINNNLAPDGGEGETADIDLISEARKVAEDAARKARGAAGAVVSQTRAATASAEDHLSEFGDDIEHGAEAVGSRAKSAAKKAKSTAKTARQSAKTKAEKLAAATKDKAEKTGKSVKSKASAAAQKSKEAAKNTAGKIHDETDKLAGRAKSAVKKPASKKPVSKKTAPKKAAPKKTASKKLAPKLKKDGTPFKKSSPKPKS